MLERRIKQRREELEIYGAEGVKHLMDQINTSEAAAVFSERGMTVLLASMEASVEAAMHRAMQDKMNQMLTGFQQGVLNFAHKQLDDAQRSLFGHVAPEPEQSEPEEVEQQEEPTEDVTEEVEEIIQELKTKAAELQDEAEMAGKTYNNVPIPRRDRGTRVGAIDWAACKKEHQRQIVLHHIEKAEEEHHFSPGHSIIKRFKRIGSDFNGAYQRCSALWPDGWNGALAEYKRNKQYTARV